MYKKYQDCGDLEETLMAACDFMERAYEQAPVVDVDSIMRDANEKIVFQLINTEQNKTFLEQVPHREFQDLSIVYKVIISADKDENFNRILSQNVKMSLDFRDVYKRQSIMSLDMR